MNIFKKLGFAKKAFDFARKHPKIFAIAAIGGVMYYGYTFMNNQIQQLTVMRETMVELKTQNQAIKDANQAITADMKAIKEGIETYQNTLNKNREETSQLQRKFQDQKFKTLVQTDVKAAERDFNQFFNDYLNGINKDTKNEK